jgi:hypothetical protein
MHHGRRPALSPKSIALMQARLRQAPQAACDEPTSAPLLHRFVQLLTWSILSAFLLLFISAPIVLLLWLLSPYNWTVVWLQSFGICAGCSLLLLLPDAARDAPWKTTVWALIIGLYGGAAYMVLNVPEQMAIADTSLGIAVGLIAALDGYEHTIPPQQSPGKAALFALVSIACFITAGLALSEYIRPSILPYEPVIPGVVLWATFVLLSSYGRKRSVTTKPE